MKKFYYILLSITVLISGCDDDFFTKAPLDGLSDSSLWKTENDVISVLNGCYQGFYSEWDIYGLDCVTDNGYDQYWWEGLTFLGNGTASPSDQYIQSYWGFGLIRRCNSFLENVDRAADVVDAKLIVRTKAEARFLRAFRYFLMERSYGDVPLITKTLSVDESNAMGRTPAAQVQKFILDELTEISKADVLPESYSGNNVGRVTRGAALALKGRYELYLGKYTEAVATYQTLMTLDYTLYPDYAGLFRLANENNSEVILDVQYIENDYASWFEPVVPISIGGWSSICVTQNLVDAYECSNGKLITDQSSGYDPTHPFKNRDSRLESTIIYPGSTYEGRIYDPKKNASDSPTGYSLRKFLPDLSDLGGNFWAAAQNMIVIRYAEVLLSYAEAKIELNQIDQSVYDAISAVRKRANMPEVDKAVYSGQSKMRELVRRERRVEFGMEGLRFWDIQRWKIGEQVMPGQLLANYPYTVVNDEFIFDPNGVRNVVEVRVFDSGKNYLWPLPQKELDANANMKPNNPGY